MRKIIIFLFSIAIFLLLAACSNTESTVIQTAIPSTVTSSERETQSQETESSSSNVLVVYFSRTGEQYNVGTIDEGNTAIVANMIAERTGADTFELLPVIDYPYSYNELINVAKDEQNNNARPAYVGETPDLSQYDIIFIGAPVWWGDWPMICYTFFENNADALAGKTLIPFSTHEGSGLSGFDSKLASTLQNSTVVEGLAIRGQDAQNNQDDVRSTVNEWLTDIGI